MSEVLTDVEKIAHQVVVSRCIRCRNLRIVDVPVYLRYDALHVQVLIDIVYRIFRLQSKCSIRLLAMRIDDWRNGMIRQPLLCSLSIELE